MARAPLRSRLSPEARREQLLQAANAVLASKQFDDVDDFTFEDVAAEAGVSRGLLYNYFDDRGQLLAALYLRAVQPLDRALIALAEFGGPPDEWARALTDIYVRATREHPTAWRRTYAAGTSFYPGLVRARLERFDRLAAAWARAGHQPGLVRIVVGMIEATMVDVLDHDEDPAERADLLVTALAATLGHGREPS
jgi:AcrR family transcriptional regulator